MAVNLKGVFLCMKAAVPHFKAQKHGRIVNISSVAGRQGVDFLFHYAASKAGVISLSQSMALQLAPYNINVNTGLSGHHLDPHVGRGESGCCNRPIPASGTPILRRSSTTSFKARFP